MKSNGFKNNGNGLKHGGFKSKGTLSSSSKLKSFRLKNKSSGQKQIDQDYKMACQEVWVRDGGACRGCGTTQRLSYSHLIPRSYRRDLVTTVKNIHLHCMDGDGIEGCHTKHSTKKWDEMLDGEQIKQTMKELDEQYFKRITI